VATFELLDGEFFMSDGTDRAMVRPLLQGRGKLLKLEEYERLLSYAPNPRVEELLEKHQQIPSIIERYPYAPPILERLPAVLDPQDPWVRAAAYIAWSFECSELSFLSARVFVDSDGDADTRARASVAVLQASPLVHSVAVEPVVEPGSGDRLIWVSFWGSPPGADGGPVRIALDLPGSYEEIRESVEGTKLQTPPEPVTLERGRLFHKALSVLINTEKPGTIDISTGWDVELNGVKP
jgi:hypothetical protein